MASITVARKWKSCAFVTSAYRVHKEDLLDGVAEVARTFGVQDDGGAGEVEALLPLAGRTAEETRAGTETFLDHVTGNMDHRATVMVAADEAKLDDVDTESLRREDLNEVAGELRRQYVHQRDAFLSLYDEKTARRVGFESSVETEPVRLMFQVRRAHNGLAAGRVKLEASYGGVVIDPAPYAKAFEPKLVELESKVHQVNFDARTTQGRLRLKNLAIQAHDAVFLSGARILEAAFRLAGMPELADQVRPSERRAGRRAQEVAAEEEGGPQAASFQDIGVEPPTLPGDDPLAEGQSDEAPEAASPVAEEPAEEPDDRPTANG